MRDSIREAASIYRSDLENGSFDWRHMLRALRWRNFRLYFVGQAFPLTGTWMQRAALVPETVRGRVMSLYCISFLGMMPFGSLIMVSLAEHLGTPRTVMVGGLLSAAASLIFAARIDSIRCCASRLKGEEASADD